MTTALLLRAKAELLSRGLPESDVLALELERAVTEQIRRAIPIGVKGGTILFHAEGHPRTEGNLIPGKHGKLIHRNDAKLQKWRRIVAKAAEVERGGCKPLPKNVPVAVGLRFRMPIPSRGRPGSKIATPGAWHVLTPDFDKLTRAVLDAITGVILTDDSQVVAWLPANGMKWVAEDEKPGVSVEIAQLG